MEVIKTIVKDEVWEEISLKLFDEVFNGKHFILQISPLNSYYRQSNEVDINPCFSDGSAFLRQFEMDLLLDTITR